MVIVNIIKKKETVIIQGEVLRGTHRLRTVRVNSLNPLQRLIKVHRKNLLVALTYPLQNRLQLKLLMKQHI